MLHRILGVHCCSPALTRVVIWIHERPFYLELHQVLLFQRLFPHSSVRDYFHDVVLEVHLDCYL